MTIVTVGIDLAKNVFAVHVMGGKAVLAGAKNKTDSVSRWALNVQARRSYWCAVVAVAAKNARLCWAMLQQGEAFKMPA